MFEGISITDYFGAAGMDPTKQEILDDIAEVIQKKWGKQAIRRGSDIVAADAFPPLPTSVSRLDAALKGGIVRGQITELYGVRTAGVTTLALRTIASAQAQEELAVYTDPIHTFNPKYAAAFHVKLQDLLVVRPPDPVMGFEIAADLVNRYSAGLFIFGHTASVEDGGREALRRLINAVRRSSCAFVILNRARTPDASPFHPYAATLLQMRRVRWLDRWGAVGGYLVKVTVIKQNGRDCQQSVTLRFDLPDGKHTR